ncbi:MAG: alpha-amylase family glycosyl hydrolase [Bacteroidetes bacterium]|nr:alpha-amylase family glycosyl hydrolase [Bacteroidota bacterium]
MFPDFAKDQCLYEVNLRQYTPSGSIRDFLAHLPRLKQLGAGILWFMPVHPIGIKNRKGSMGSYYAVRDYLAVDPLYGTFDEFKCLVDQVHGQGMYVILDWVANHTSWDNLLTITHPEFYKKGPGGGFIPPFPEWEDVIQLDYTNTGLRKYMTKAMQFWVEEAGIDGFRCDMANLVPTDFWKESTDVLGKIKPLYMLAEASGRELLENGFTTIYNWNIHHFMNHLLTEVTPALAIDSQLDKEIFSFPQSGSQLFFTSNHDENSWNGSEIERMGAALEPCTVLSFTLPGIPLIYNGQEAGMLKRLKFFDKDEIPWKEDKMGTLYKNLCRLKKNNPTLWTGPYGGNFRRLYNPGNSAVFSFIREKNGRKVLVMLNFSWNSAEFTLEGYTTTGEYRDLFTQQPVFLAPGAKHALPAWGYRILEK